MNQGKILIVEDEKEIQNLLKKILKSFDYELLFSSSANQALSLLQDQGNTISLIILDLLMPERSGWDIFPELRKNYPKTKILISSGYADINAINKVIIPGKVESLPKPYSVKEFRDTVCRLMES